VTRDGRQYEPGAFDVRGPNPRSTALACAIATLAAGDTVLHPAIAGTPWWRRPDRIIHGAGRASPRAVEGPPVLIIGSTGTLGRAFQRICEVRGLSAQLVGRRDVDITDPTRVDAILRRLEPWAVINAAGYVRVDEAEHDAEACRRANVTGPVNLAAACRRRGVPLVTFSSDLVFDGREGRAYVEDDETRPLNVYGQTKAEAERRVGELLPEALIIRTSAFFGPWDDYNFLACLLRALDGRTKFPAPADSTVSPTYVPDLVHASLDLLIDGECGVWHLANRGAVTWFDFARAAASGSGRDVDMIEPVETAQAWSPAARPQHSPLSSSRGRLMRPLHEALAAYLREAPQARLATGTDGCASR
jgi:dTDP-4-dehydrorhamnose reductase